MRIVSVLGIVAIAVMLTPIAPLVPAAPPAPLPDLSITADDIEFLQYVSPVFYSDEMGKYIAFAGDYITLNITIFNYGMVTSPPANVSFYDNDLFMATVPTAGDIPASGADNYSFAQYVWNPDLSMVGNHTIRVEVTGPDGDSNSENNIAHQDIQIYRNFPFLSLSFDDSNPVVNVTPTSEGIVNLTGHARIDRTEDQSVNVSLEAIVDVGWKTVLSPENMRFDAGPQEDFTVEIVVPAATSESILGKLTLNALIKMDGMWETTKTESLIRVAPYFRLAVVPDAEKSEIAPAQSADFSVTVTNYGNAVDSYKLQIENRNELEQKGWNITISQDSLNKMYPAESRTVRISAHAPTDWAPWKSETTTIRLNISSVDAPDFGMNFSKTSNLTVRQNGFFLPGVAVVLALPLAALVAAGLFMYVRRGRKKPKTVADYDKELDI